MNCRAVIAIFVLMPGALFQTSASAEDAPPQGRRVSIEGELNFIVGLPQGRFKRNTEAAGYGAEMFGGIRMPKVPIVFGVQLGALTYGSEHRSEPFSSTIPDVKVDVNTRSDILLAHLVLRVQPRSWRVRPHLDVLIGLKHFFTVTNVGGRNDSDDIIASDTNQSDTAFSYGVGAGLTVPVFKLGDASDSPTFNLGIGARYLFGEKAEYLKAGSIRREDETVTIDVKSSRTDLVVLQFGIGGTF